MNKIYITLGLCLMLCLASVSAMTIENVETSYDKKSNTASCYFSSTLENECNIYRIEVKDHKGNTVGLISERYICAICTYDGRCFFDARKTGTFDIYKELGLKDKKDIKGLGNLVLTLSNPWDPSEVYAEGRLK